MNTKKKMKNLTKKKAVKTAKVKKYTAKYLINKAINGYVAGQTITIDVDKEGLPIKKYWRRRLVDAKIDNCMEKAPKNLKSKSKK